MTITSLTDKDRIFTNLYGYQPWGLKAAQQRGDWDDTKALLALGLDAFIDVVKESGLRGRHQGLLDLHRIAHGASDDAPLVLLVIGLGTTEPGVELVGIVADERVTDHAETSSRAESSSSRAPRSARGLIAILMPVFCPGGRGRNQKW